MLYANGYIGEYWMKVENYRKFEKYNDTVCLRVKATTYESVILRRSFDVIIFIDTESEDKFIVMVI